MPEAQILTKYLYPTSTYDNQLSYVDENTKISAVNRHDRFPATISKLFAICETGVTFKYQFAGEYLDGGLRMHL